VAPDISNFVGDNTGFVTTEIVVLIPISAIF
jgi:hypothetical protein